MPSVRPRLCAAALLLVFVVLAGVSARYDTYTYDEPAHLAFGEAVLAGTMHHADMQKMPITALNAVPQRVLRAMNVRVSELDAVWISRLPTLVCAAALGWLVFLWASRLYGTNGGLLSLVLFALCPTFIAHGRVVTTDLYCAAFCFAAVFAASAYMRTLSWARLIAAAVLMGIAQLTKHTAVLVMPVMLVVFVLRRWRIWRTPPVVGRPSAGDPAVAGTEQRVVGPRTGRRALGRDLLQMAVFLIVALVVLNAGYRFEGTFETVSTHQRWLQANQQYMPVRPAAGSLASRLNGVVERVRLPLPRAYVEAFLLGQYYNATGAGHGPNYLFGYRSQFGWFFYFPIAFLLKTPLATLIVLAVALRAALRAGRMSPAHDDPLLLGAAVAVFLYFSFLCTAQIGVRYLLPAIPFLYVFAGQAAAFRSRAHPRIFAAAVVVLALWLPLSVLSYFPHYVSYFNEVCWNRLQLYRCLADSNLDWGQDGRALDQYLAAHRGQPISVNPPGPVTGTVIVPVNNLVGVIAAPATYAWLREHHRPVDRIAYSWLVYQIPEAPKTRP